MNDVILSAQDAVQAVDTNAGLKTIGYGLSTIGQAWVSVSSPVRLLKVWLASPRWPASCVPPCSWASPSPRLSPSSAWLPVSFSKSGPSSGDNVNHDRFHLFASCGRGCLWRASSTRCYQRLMTSSGPVFALAFILVLFWKFVLPKFQEVLTEREDRIEGGIERAEAAQAEAKAALEKYNSQLAEARTEAAKIRDEARAQGQRIITEATTKANDESARIIDAGEKQLAAQREQVVAELRKEMGQNSINLAERLLGEQLSDDVRNVVDHR